MRWLNRLARALGGIVVAAYLGIHAVAHAHPAPGFNTGLFVAGGMVVVALLITEPAMRERRPTLHVGRLDGYPGVRIEPPVRGGHRRPIVDHDERVPLNEYRRRGAELAAAPPDEAVAQEWSDAVVKFLSERRWPFADIERFQNAGTGTAADRLRPRADALGVLIARLGSSATEDGQSRG